jgi:hypothetical protein
MPLEFGHFFARRVNTKKPRPSMRPILSSGAVLKAFWVGFFLILASFANSGSLTGFGFEGAVRGTSTVLFKHKSWLLLAEERNWLKRATE